MKNIILTFLALCSAISCKQGVPQKKEQTIDSIDSVKTVSVNESKEQVETVPQVMVKGCNQSFDTFFERFAKDSIFQKNRVKYPMKDSYIESLDPTIIKVDSMTYKKYTYLDFTKDKDAMNNKYGKYTAETKKINDSLFHYFWVGYDNGIHVTYKFNLIDGCWYMVEILDEST